MAEIPVISDPYVGTVYGNILDTFDNPSYNIRLYMVRKSYADAITKEDFYIDNLIAPPADTVILAQTGVTGTQIDNVEIESMLTPDKGTNLEVTFTIVQPGAATFLDEIQYAKGYLGYEATSETIAFLEIRFQGYETDFEDNEEGGAPAKILGPIIYKLNLQEFTLALDNAGTTYDFTAIIVDTLAYRDNIFRTPQVLTTTGATITEHVEKFKLSINEWHTDTTAHQVPDEIEIDLSELINTGLGNSDVTSQSYITNENLLTSKDIGQTDTVNRVMNETWELRTKLEQQEALESAPKDEGNAPEVQFDGDNLRIKEGTTIEEFFYILLSMCPDFYDKISRKESIDDPDSKVRTDQATVTWFKILATTEQLEYDPSRQKYAYRYTYTPVLYKTANPNIAVDIDELNPTLADTQARVRSFIEAGTLLKAYNYYFTGLNDQILNLDITYKSVSAMLPPKYGAIGDIAQTSQNKISDSAPEGEDQSFAGRLDSTLGKAKEKSDKNSFGDFVNAIKDIKDGTQDALTSVANFIGAETGYSDQEILQIIQDEAARNSLFEELSADARSQLGALQVQSEGPATEPPSVTDTPDAPGGYTPEASGYVYSADFIVQEPTDALDASALAELGYIQAGKPPELKQSAEASKDIKSEAEAATVKMGSTRNKLFGFITEQQNSTDFLLDISMSVRGDPWFLAAADLSKPSNATANFKRDHLQFWLRIASPQKFDPDWTDEDNNTGYWAFDGTSQTFSGVYTFQTVSNKFSNGQYTVDFTGFRTLSLNAPLAESANATTGDNE